MIEGSVAIVQHRLMAACDLLQNINNHARVKTWASWKGYKSGELGEAHEDVLIVAGDISSSLERTAETLTDLKERYDEVRGCLV